MRTILIALFMALCLGSGGIVYGGDVTWTGSAGDKVWDTSSGNWTGGTDSKFTTGDNVTFNTPSSATAITVTDSGVTTGAMIVNGEGIKNYTFSGGKISSDTSLKVNYNTTFKNEFDFDGGVTLANNAVVTFNGYTGTFVNDNNFSGAGELKILVGGTLVLTGNIDSQNNSSKSISMTTGTLQIGDGTTIGTIAGSISVGNNRTGATLVFNTGSADYTFAQNITDSGLGNLTKLGTSTLTLTGTNNTNSYTGNTTVSAGTLQIGSGGTGGYVRGNITNNAAVIFNRSDAVTYDKVISGTGTLEKKGVGTLTLTGTNTYTGNTTVTAGTLQIGDGAAAGSIAGNIANSTAVIFNRSDAVTYDKVISGTGTLEKKGSDSLTLSGTNTYSGNTTVTDGSLIVTGTLGASGVYSGNISVASGKNLTFNQSSDQTLSGTVSATSATIKKEGAGTLTLNTSGTIGTLDVDAGTVAVSAGKTLTATTVDLAANATIKVDVGSNPAISVGTFTNSTNSIIDITGYSGSTTFPVTLVNATNDITRNYTLKIGGQAISSTIDIDTYLDLKEDTSNNKNITIAGGLVWNNNNDKLSGQNAQTAHGTFNIATGGEFTVGSVLENNISAGSDTGFAGWGGTDLTKKGDGTLILSAANTYTGGSDIQAGTLKATNLKALGISTAIVRNNAVLEANFVTLASGDMSALAAMTGKVALDAGGAFKLVVADNYTIGDNLALSSAAATSTFTLDSANKTITLASGKSIDAKGADVSLTNNTTFDGTNATVVTTGKFLVAGTLVADGDDMAVNASSVDFAADSGIAIGKNTAGDGAAKIIVSGNITVAGTASVVLRDSLVNLGEAANDSIILESTSGSFSAANAANFTLPTDMFTEFSLDTTTNSNALTLIAKKRDDDKQENVLIDQVESITGVDRDSAFTSIHTGSEGTFAQSMTSAFGDSTAPARVAFGIFDTYKTANPGTWTWSDALDEVHNSGNSELASMTLEGLQNTVYLRQVAMGTAEGLYSGDNWAMTGVIATGAVDASVETVGRIADLNVGRGMALSKEFLSTPTSGIQSGGAYPSLLMNGQHQNRVWAGAFGVWEDMGKKDNYNGYKYDAHGFIIGYDRFFGPIAFGASFAYAKGDLDEKEVIGDGDIDSYSVNLYGSYTHRSGVFAFLHGGYTYSDNKMNRIVNSTWNRSKYHTNSWNLGGRVGYQASLTPNFMLTPTIGLEYVLAKNNDFDANGGVFQRYTGVKGKSLRLPVEVEASYTAKAGCDSSITFTAKGGYAYEFHNKGVTGQMTYVGVPGWNPTSIRGVKPGRHSWNVGGGIKFETRRFDAEISYQYTGRKKLDNHQLMGTVGIKF